MREHADVETRARSTARPEARGDSLGLFDKHHGPDRAPAGTTVPEPTPLPSHHPLEGVGRTALPGEVELRNRAFCFTPAQRMAAIGTAMLPLIVVVVFVVVMIARATEGADAPSSEELARELGAGVLDRLLEDVVQLGLFVLTTVIGLFAMLRGSRERLFVGPDGVRYFSGFPAWLGPLGGSWSVSAARIRDVRAVPSRLGGAPALLQIVFETETGSRSFGVFTYVDATRYDAAAFRALSRTRPDPSEIAALFEAMPLVEYARSIGFDPRMPEPARPSELEIDFSLSDRPRVAAALMLSFAGFGYAVLDLGLVSETYASGAPILMIIAGGAAVGALAWALLGSREVSGLGRGAVAAMLAAVAMLALYPGLIRVNRIGAPDPAPHAYRHGAAGFLEPVAPSSPDVDLPLVIEMLEGSEPGDVHELWLRKGPLGFLQLDIDRLDDRRDELERERRRASEDAEPEAGE